MSYTLTFGITLGSSKTGLTLNATILDTVGAVVSGPTATGFVEIGNGHYSWTGSIPDSHRGAVKFTNGATVEAISAINPEEAETITKLQTTTTASVQYNSLVNQISTMQGIMVGQFAITNGYLGPMSVQMTTVETNTNDLLTITTDIQTTVDAIEVIVSALGPGFGEKDIVVTVTKTTDQGVVVVEGAEVWITTTPNIGEPRLRQGFTDSLGVVHFNLDDGTYYVWCGQNNTNFVNPTTLTVV